MSGATTALTVASIGATVAGSIASGYATSASDKANASIAKSNATIAQQNATFAGEEGEQTAGVEGQKTRQIAGAQKAGMGASGVDVNTGSNANVQAGEAMTGQLNMMNIRAQAARQAYGFDTQAVSDENQASIDKSSAKNAVTAGYIGGVTKAVGEAATADREGAFSGTPSSDTDLISGGGTSDPWNDKMSGSALNGGVH